MLEEKANNHKYEDYANHKQYKPENWTGVYACQID